MHIRRTTALLLAIAHAVAGPSTTAPASATVVPTKGHCVVETAPAAGSALEVTSITCFDEFDKALAVLDAPQWMIDRIDHPHELTPADMDILGPPDDHTATTTTTNPDSTTTSSSDDAMFAASTFTVGVHYDGASFTGASFSVTGSACAGGYLDMSSTWNNRVTSTLNGCPKIVHYDGYSLVGTTQTTTGGGGTLTYMDNRTSSIQYRN